MRILSPVLIILMVFTSVGFAEQAAVESPQVAKIKAEVRKHGSGESSKVRVTLSKGTIIKGYISGIDESSFDVNGKRGQATSISYADIQKIQGPGLSTPAKVAIVVAVAVAAAAIVFAVAYKKSGLSR